MCHVCDALAPFLRPKFPPACHPEVYKWHYTSSLPCDPRLVSKVTDKAALEYLSSGASPWCERLCLYFPSDPSRGQAIVLQLKTPWGSGVFVPQVTTGNGNCLVHAASRGIFGTAVGDVMYVLCVHIVMLRGS